MIFGQTFGRACPQPKPAVTPGSPLVDYTCDPEYGTWQPVIRITKDLPSAPVPQPAPVPVPAPAPAPQPTVMPAPPPAPLKPKPAPPVVPATPRWHLLAALLALPAAAVIAGIAAAASDGDRAFAGSRRR
jgi:hypothetical protein